MLTQSHQDHLPRADVTMDLARVLRFPIFQKGCVVEHAYYHYRGVIFQIDSNFKGDEQWYEFMTRGNPCKKSPWYHLLVHDCIHTTYVPEEYLKKSLDQFEIHHPLIGKYFNQFLDGRYVLILS